MDHPSAAPVSSEPLAVPLTASGPGTGDADPFDGHEVGRLFLERRAGRPRGRSGEGVHAPLGQARRGDQRAESVARDAAAVRVERHLEVGRRVRNFAELDPYGRQRVPGLAGPGGERLGPLRAGRAQVMAGVAGLPRVADQRGGGLRVFDERPNDTADAMIGVDHGIVGVDDVEGLPVRPDAVGVVVFLVKRKVETGFGSVGQFHAPHRGVVRGEPDAPHRPPVGEEAPQLAPAGDRQLPGGVRPPVFVLRRLRVVEQTEGVRVRRGVGDPQVTAVRRRAAHDEHSPSDVQAPVDEVPVLRPRVIRQVVAEDVPAGAVKGLFGHVQAGAVTGDVEVLLAQGWNIYARVAGAVLAGLGAGVVPKLVGEHLGPSIVAHPKRLAVRPYALRARVLRMQRKSSSWIHSL